VQPIPIKFPVLQPSIYLEIVDRANERVRANLKPPQWGAYQVKGVSTYPRWFTYTIVITLIAVMAFSFVISAGKQAAAMGIILDELPGRFNHLSVGWANMSIVFMLLLSELGTIFFLVVGGTIGQTVPMSEIFGVRINFVAWFLRLIAILCAAFGIVANTTITALDISAQAPVLQWLVTLGIPSIVLALGMMLERMFLDSLKASADARERFEQAQAEYRAHYTDPERHPHYTAILFDMLYQEMVKQRRDGPTIKSLVESDPRYRRFLVNAEYKTQIEAGQIDLNLDVSAFLTAPAPSVSTIQRDTAPVQSQISKAIDWIKAHDNWNDSYSWRKGAEAAGVSLPTFQRAAAQVNEYSEKGAINE
jgi:hypothetical protein